MSARFKSCINGRKIIFFAEFNGILAASVADKLTMILPRRKDADMAGFMSSVTP
jgi:hypothetical protein